MQRENEAFHKAHSQIVHGTGPADRLRLLEIAVTEVLLCFVG